MNMLEIEIYHGFSFDEQEALKNIPSLIASMAKQFDLPVCSVATLIIRQDKKSILVVNVEGTSDDYFFREEALIWKNFAVVGVGEQITLINLLDRSAKTIRFDGIVGYFGYLYTIDTALLAASASDLYCFGIDGELRWTRKNLGIDGVIVNQIENGVIEGEGEFDPPGGWRPFRVSLETGLDFRRYPDS
jgi:hypothetical protein